MPPLAFLATRAHCWVMTNCWSTRTPLTSGAICWLLVNCWPTVGQPWHHWPSWPPGHTAGSWPTVGQPGHHWPPGQSVGSWPPVGQLLATRRPSLNLEPSRCHPRSQSSLGAACSAGHGAAGSHRASPHSPFWGEVCGLRWGCLGARMGLSHVPPCAEWEHHRAAAAGGLCSLRGLVHCCLHPGC